MGRNERVLVIGACGGVGRLLTRSLTDDGHEVIGVDKRRWRGAVPDGVELHATGLTKRPFEDLFRRYAPGAVAHVGLVSSPRMTMEARHEHNVVGMQNVVNVCGRYKVRRLVVMSRGSVYGADLHNPVRLNEDSPLRGASNYAGLRDIVEADILAQSLAIRHPELSMAILRPTNVVGRRVRNTMVSYLRLPLVPTLLGYDPMLQLVHEEDLVHAIRLTLDSDAPGVFNIRGPGEAPLSVLIRETGGRAVPVLLPFFGPLVESLWRRGLSPAPLPHVDFLRYPCLLEGKRARAELGYAPRLTMRQTVQAVRDAPRTDDSLTDIFRSDKESLEPA